MTSKPNDNGDRYRVNFKQSINLDQVNENVYPFEDGTAPHLTNTGILHDDGVTNLYQTTTDDSASYDQVLFAPNGKKIGLKYSTQQVFVDGVGVAGTLGNFSISDVTLPFNPIDVAITIAGNFLLLSEEPSSATTGASSYRVTEWNPSTGATVGSVLFVDVSLTPVSKQVVLVKRSGQTLANTTIVSYSYNATSTFLYWTSTSTNQTIFAGAGSPQMYQGISAFYNGGTVVIGGVSDGSTCNRVYYNTVPGAFGAWTTITEGAFLWYPSQLWWNDQQPLNLLCHGSNIATANLTKWGTRITVSNVGVVTTLVYNVAGLTIVPSDTYSGWGFFSGKFKSTAATKFSPFVQYGAAFPQRIDYATTDYAIKPQALSYTTGGATNLTTAIHTINGTPSHVSYGQAVGAFFQWGMMTPVGTLAQDTCIVMWGPTFGTEGTSSANYVTIPTVINGSRVFQVKKATYRAGFTVSPISSSVVQINSSSGIIVDTERLVSEYNQGAYTNSFMGDIFLTGSNQIAFQTIAKYTNSPDMGVTTGVAGGTPTAATFLTVGTIAPSILFQSATGTLFSKFYVAPNSVSYAPNSIAYVTNANLPAPVTSRFSNGGVEMGVSSALQTVNESDADGFAQYYAGYTLANLYPVAYKFFNLFGQLYGFDGNKIYRMPVNGGTAGTPEQVAIASGLTFIVNSPTVAAFTSTYDNSLWVFTGGQTLTKWKEMTGVASVTSGVYANRESALFLQLSDNTVLIFRDDQASQLANAYTSQTTYTTDLGVYFVNNASTANSATWTYTAGSGTPITLTWQSGYYGFGMDRYMRCTEIVFTFKIADPSTTNITINYKYIDSGTGGSETATVNGGTYTASPTGYARICYRPTQPNGYGVSFGIQVTKKVVLYEAVLYFSDGGMASVTLPSGNYLP